MKKLDIDFFKVLLSIPQTNCIDTQKISDVLESFCEYSAFECAAIYELNHLNKFYLAEHFVSNNISLITQLMISDYLLEDRIYYIQRNDLEECKIKVLSFEMNMLQLYVAKTIVLVPIMDDKHNAYGFIILFSVGQEIVLEAEELEMLSSLLFTLVHFVDGRIYQRKIAQNITVLDKILDNSGIDIYVNDYYTQEILYANSSMAAPYGGTDKLIGRKCWEALFPGQTGLCEFCPKQHIVDEAGEPSKVFSWDYQRFSDGAWFRVFSSAFYWTNGRLAHIASSADISENKSNEALIEHLANYDQLTQLPNRRMLLKELEKWIHNANQIENGYLLFFDIDGFKGINDKYGHDIGDKFLIQLAEFFSSIVLLKETIYRDGGDEFLAIIKNENISKENITDLIELIHKRFQQPWVIYDYKVFCNVSVGVACYPEDGLEADTLFYKADQAMYQIKKTGGAGLCFGYQLNKK